MVSPSMPHHSHYHCTYGIPICTDIHWYQPKNQHTYHKNLGYDQNNFGMVAAAAPSDDEGDGEEDENEGGHGDEEDDGDEEVDIDNEEGW